MRLIRAALCGSCLLIVNVTGTARGEETGHDTTDATQRLDSPMTVGSGLTFTISQAKDALTLGVSEQLSVPWFWQLGVEGKVEKGAESAPLFGTAGGISPGVTVKLGFGFSSFLTQDNSIHHSACNKFKVYAVTYRRQKEAQESESTCWKTLEELAGRLKLADIASTSAPSCAAGVGVLYAKMVSLAADGKLDSKSALLLNALDDLRIRAVASDELQLIDQLTRMMSRHDNEDDEDDKIETVKQPSCNDLAGDDQILKDYFARYVQPLDRSRVATKVSLNGLFEARGIKYQPIDATGAVTPGDSKDFVPMLPGASLDGIVYYEAFVGGAQVGYRKSVDPHYQQVCTTQTVGTTSTQDCSQASLGKPLVGDALFATVALSLNPLVPSGLGGLVPGAEILAQASSANTTPKSGPAPELFSSKSWTYTFSVPLFVAAKDAPWGLRAGVAPQLQIQTQDGNNPSFSMSLFVGTKFGQVPTR